MVAASGGGSAAAKRAAGACGDAPDSDIPWRKRIEPAMMNTAMSLTNGRRRRHDGSGPYELEVAVPAPPPLPGDAVVRATADEAIDALAADVVIHALNCVRQFGDFHVALSGGALLEPLYERLMYDPDFRRLPWRRTHVWFAWERRVPFDDERSAFRLISETVGDHADVPPEQFHPIFAQSESAAHDYEAQLREVLAWREKGQDRLDCVLLAIEPDGALPGHAGGAALAPDLGRLVHGPGEGGDDVVAMTLPFINAARFVAILALGEQRAAAIQEIGAAASAGAGGAELPLPVARIAPVSGELKWYLDAPACGAADGAA
jgi:6-phosphogluconolactonase/glucosamine-6-phosphate isomerase/deaminase